jgi:succinoglycan biosynthesis protein ExoA
MLSPKSNLESAAHADVLRDDLSGGPRRRNAVDERRSFASQDLGHGFADIAWAWPAAWRDLPSSNLIQVADAAANANEPVQPARAIDPRKRALIVIPTLNEERVVAQVIARVLEDDGLEDPLVLVADGGSTDRTREIVTGIAVDDARVRLLDNPARLQSAGLNLAVKTLAGDRPWVVRVDAHADYPTNYASSLIAEAMHTGATSVVVSMDTLGQPGFQRAVAIAQNSVLGAGGSAHRVASEGQWVDHGHHALFSRDAYQSVGGYDESFSHNEDAELDLRLAQQGGRIWLTDQVRIGYYPRSTPGALARQYFNYGAGRAKTVLKHYQPLKVRQALPLAVAPAILSAVASPLFLPLAVPALVWMFAALTLGVMLAVKKRDAWALLSGPAGMIMHASWSTGFWTQLIRHATQRSGLADMAAPSLAEAA